MKIVLKAVFGLFVSLMLISCSPSYESKGNAAYEAAQAEKGDAKRLLQKEAYIYFQKAIKAHPDKISTKLRNRFIEMTLVRANMVLTAGSADMDALPLFMEDIDSTLAPEVEPELRTQYANFIVKLADSSCGQHKIHECLRQLDKAMEVAPDKSAIQEKKKSIIDNMADENYEIAKVELESGQANEDNEAMIRAEYHAKLALFYDKDHKEAEELLSSLYKKNLSSYSAYDAVITDKPDSNVYDMINKYDILLAVPAQKAAGGRMTLKTIMYNYSYNPLRLFAKDFMLIDVNGKEYPATKSSKIEKEILDQEHELEMTLVFPNPKEKIKKLAYKNGEHYTEKNFF